MARAPGATAGSRPYFLRRFLIWVRIGRFVGEPPPPRYRASPAGPRGAAGSKDRAIFRVYLRWPDQRVTDKTVTSHGELAWLAYSALCARSDLRGQSVAAVVTANGRQLAYHAFDDGDPGKDR